MITFCYINEGEHFLLLYDGHSSIFHLDYLNGQTLTALSCLYYGPILLIFYNPKCISFSTFTKCYYYECATYMKLNIGQTITKYEMYEMICQACLKVMTSRNISECFRDEKPLKKVQAIKSSQDAIMAYLRERWIKNHH